MSPTDSHYPPIFALQVQGLPPNVYALYRHPAARRRVREEAELQASHLQELAFQLGQPSDAALQHFM